MLESFAISLMYDMETTGNGINYYMGMQNKFFSKLKLARDIHLEKSAINVTI